MRPSTLRFGLPFRPPPTLPLLALIAVGGSAFWTLLGCLVAAIGGQFDQFIREWVLAQGFFSVLAAIFLGFIALSPALEQTVRTLGPDAATATMWTRPRAMAAGRWAVIVFVAGIGTLTTTHLGFETPPPGRYFMWFTCGLICILAGFATWHAVDVMRVASSLHMLRIKFFVYSPGDTKSLKHLAVHFVVFGLGMTVGYVFAVVGTLSPLWTGNPVLVRAIQAFWPMIYVPLCIAVTTYPHVMIYRLIRQEKDRLIGSYQEEINGIIGEGHSLTKQDIERVNALADLIRRIESSPRFAVNFPIALGTVVTYVVNIGSLFVPKELLVHVVRSLASY